MGEWITKEVRRGGLKTTVYTRMLWTGEVQFYVSVDRHVIRCCMISISRKVSKE